MQFLHAKPEHAVHEPEAPPTFSRKLNPRFRGNEYPWTTSEKENKVNQYVFVLTELFSKLSREVVVTKTKATHIATISLDCWVIPYGIPSYVLTDIGPQIVAMFLASICAFLGIKKLTSTSYHPQTNGQTERYNKEIVPRLRHCVA